MTWQHVVVIVVVLLACAESWREVRTYRYDMRHGTWHGVKSPARVKFEREHPHVDTSHW